MQRPRSFPFSKKPISNAGTSSADCHYTPSLTHRNRQQTRWKSPEENQVKVNIDASFLNSGQTFLGDIAEMETSCWRLHIIIRRYVLEAEARGSRAPSTAILETWEQLAAYMKTSSNRSLLFKVQSEFHFLPHIYAFVTLITSYNIKSSKLTVLELF